MRCNMNSIWPEKPSLKHIKSGASGTLENSQKSLSSLTYVKKKDKKIRRDGEYFLKYKGGEETGKWIILFASEVMVKGVIEDRRDKFRDIEYSSRNRKKEGVSSKSISSNSEKVSFNEI